MATYTDNFNLRKPTVNDNVNVDLDIAGNMDLLDAHAHSGTYVAVVTGMSAAGAADNATIIQAAINTAFTAGGGTVIIPIGTWPTSQLRMKAKVRLVGLGWGSCLRLVGNTDFIILDSATATEQVEIADLYLDGYKSVNTTAGDGIKFATTSFTTGAFPSGLNNPRHKISRVLLRNIKGNGINLAGDAFGGDVEVTGCQAYHCDAVSYLVNVPDSVFTNCDSGQAGLYGFRDTSGNNRFVGCKSWISGRLDVAQGDGFYVSGAGYSKFVGCEAQDNKRHGFNFFSRPGIIMAGCTADTNGVGTTGVGIAMAGATYCNIQATCFDRGGDSGLDPAVQQFAIDLDSGATASKNVIAITSGPVVHGPYNGYPAVPGDNVIMVTQLGSATVSTFGDGSTLGLGTTTGTKIGQSSTEKMGFYGATPVVRPAGTTDLLASLVTLGLRAASSNPPLDLGTGTVTAGGVTVADAGNIAVGTSTGTKIGTATSQKLGFFNATPVVQPTSTTDLKAALVALGLIVGGGATGLNLNGGNVFTSGTVSGTGGLNSGSNTTANAIAANGPAASARQLLFQTAGVSRWIARANSTAEGGANAGSDLEIAARDDAGAALSTSLIIRRSDARATFAGEVVTPAGTTTTAGLNVPHGAAPTSPVNGDIWTTTAGLFVRINGATVGPLS